MADYLQHLTDVANCNGKEYDLNSSIKDSNITITGKIKPGEANVIGYITFKRLLELDEKVHTGNILKCGITPDMLDKKWEHLFAVKVEGGENIPNKTMLVICDHDLLLEKITRMLVLPLNLDSAKMTVLAKEINAYSKTVVEREKDKNLAQMAKQLAGMESISFDVALDRLKGKVKA